MKYLDHDGTYKTFVCGRCHAELVFNDERDDEGIGTVFFNCPDCPDQKGFAFYGGQVDLGLVTDEQLREQTNPDNRFEVFPQC